MNTLISVHDLLALQASGTRPVLLDCGFELTDLSAGERAYAAGHLPGAVYAHLETELSGPKVDREGVFRGRHPLPSRDDFAAAAGRWGIAPGTPVVAYDAQGGPYAARAWWLLRWLGHDAVWVLDGGLQAWKAAGGALTAEPGVAADVGPCLARSPAHPAAMPTIEAAALLARLGCTRLLDARAGERFRGEMEPIDPTPGHIPGARSRPFKDNLATDGRFKDRDRLRAEWAPLVARPAGETVVQMCGSGVTAAHNVLAMAHAGLGDSVLYPGSWSEWCADPKRPVARGA
jgi:thiosulfate/3-mercaptopyruvate sulfurtransferase